MAEEVLVKLEQLGHRIPELVNRFAGNEAICIKLIKKFPADTSYTDFMNHIKVQNYKEAEQSVHTLKGVTSNLGLTMISELSQEILNGLRSDQLSNMDALTEQLGIVYKDTITVLEPYM